MAHSALAGEVGNIVTGGGAVELDEGGGELRGVDRAVLVVGGARVHASVWVAATLRCSLAPRPIGPMVHW